MLKRILAMAAVLMAILALAGCGQQAGQQQGGAQAGDAEAAAAGAPGEARSYTISHIDGAPDWAAIPQLDIDNVQWTDDYGIRAHAQLAYDDIAIYVHLWADEADIRAEHQRDEVMPNAYEDSCLEFFFMPVADDARYVNIECNPNCAMCAQVGVEKANRVWAIPADGIADTFAAVSDRIEGGWEVSYAIPFSYIRTLFPGFSAQPGLQMRGNLYKCGNLTAHKHYLSWNPVDSETPNFHQPASFGTLVFE